MSDRLLIALQVCQADQKAAWGLLDLCCDLWGRYFIPADLMIVRRREVPKPETKLWAQCFGQIHDRVVPSEEVGWPLGPNVTVRCAWEEFLKLTDYDSVWLWEPDCLPTKRDFLALITEEWATRSPDQHVMGWMQMPGQITTNLQPHINGNLLLDRQFAAICPDFLTDPKMDRTAWDHYYREPLVKHALISRHIYSRHQWGQRGSKPWTGCDSLFGPMPLPPHHPFGEPTFQPAWVHGNKQWREAQGCVRSRLLERRFTGIGESAHNVVAGKHS